MSESEPQHGEPGAYERPEHGTPVPADDEPGAESRPASEAEVEAHAEQHAMDSGGAEPSREQSPAEGTTGAAFPRAEAIGSDAVERAAQIFDRWSARLNQRFEALGRDVDAPAGRADDVLHETTTRAGEVGDMIGDRARRMLARAREEAEDIWAEAQHIRQRTER